MARPYYLRGVPDKKVKELKPNVTDVVKKCRSLLNGSRIKTYKVRAGSCKFTNPKSLVHPKAPKYERKPIPDEEFDAPFNILRYPIRSERISALIENNNTVVFIVRREATKPYISNAFNVVFQVKPIKVNTLITPRGDKKAFIKLPKDVRAEDIAASYTPK